MRYIVRDSRDGNHRPRVSPAPDDLSPERPDLLAICHYDEGMKRRLQRFGGEYAGLGRATVCHAAVGSPHRPRKDNAMSHHAQRVELENWLAQLYSLLTQVDAYWQERAGLQSQFRHGSTLKQKWGLWPAALWTAGFAIAGLTILLPISEVVVRIVLLPFSVFLPGIQFQATASLVVLVVLSAGLAALLVTIRNRVWLTRANIKAHAVNEAVRLQNESIAGEIQRVDAQILDANASLLIHVGRGYPEKDLYPNAVAFCWHAVHDHRANTLQEALQLYDIQLKHDEQLRVQQAQVVEMQRIRKQAALGSVINASMQGAMIGTMIDQGNKTRSAMKAPVTVRFKK